MTGPPSGFAAESLPPIPKSQSRAAGEETRLGFIVPSSNVQVEPLACRLLSHLSGCTAHFARIPVETVEAEASSASQFALGRLLDAAKELLDARVDAVAWAGTSGSWLGMEHDHELAEHLATLGVRGTTATLSVLDACEHLGVRRVGLITPYTSALVRAISTNLASWGFEVVDERHLDITDSYACSKVTATEIGRVIGDVSRSRLDGIVILCTNLIFDRRIASVERELGVPVIDSAVATIWRACTIAGAWSPLQDAGSLLGSVTPACAEEAR